jgi:hypothetical protein
MVRQQHIYPCYCSRLTYQTFIADKVVQVPQMAESISEGTLKQWVKSE